MREMPLFLKCCGCCALRFCLLVWAFLRLIGDAFVVLGLVILPLHFWFVYKFDDPKYELSTIEYIALILLIYIVMDFIFVLIFIAGVIWKKIKVLKLFLFYGVFMLVAEIAWILFICGIMRSVHSLTGWIIFIVSVVLWIAIDITIMLTIQSEIKKLQNKELDNLNAFNVETGTDTRSVVLTGLAQLNDVEEKTHLNQADVQINKYEACD